MHSPTDEHWNVVKRILRYLKEHSLMVFISLILHLFNFMPIQMQTGRAVLMTDVQQLVSVFFWAQIYSHGVQRSKRQ